MNHAFSSVSAARPPLVRILRSAILLGSWFLGPLSLVATDPPARAFQPSGMWIWDNWFAHDGQQWHAFYLQLPKAVGLERRWKDNDPYKHVGHAVSTNLVDWQDLGPALCALPGTWNDRHIATGSIIHHNRRWWMFFTGRGREGDGVGLALSDDLTTWKTEAQPVLPLLDTFAKGGAAAFESAWGEHSRKWIGISDPFVYPEPIEGWFYLVLCARILDVPIEESGCLTLLRSRNLRQWESAGIIAWPGCFERMETPQLWPHGDRWYVSFGGVLNSAWIEKNQASLPDAVRGRRSHLNYIYTLTDFRQPARSEDLRFVSAPSGCYIMKVLPQSQDSEVALFTSTDARGSCLSLPSKVSYPTEGGLRLEPLSALHQDGHQWPPNLQK